MEWKSVVCPVCDADIGKRCINTDPGKHHEARRLAALGATLRAEQERKGK